MIKKIKLWFSNYIFIILSVVNIILTILLTYIGIGAFPCKEWGILKQNNTNITNKGNVLLTIVALLIIVSSSMVIVLEKKTLKEKEKLLCTEEKSRECKGLFTKKQMQKRYTQSLLECQEVIILVKDLDYLQDNKEQKERIKDLGGNCSILYSNCKNRDIYTEIKEAGVNLYIAPNRKSISKLKGQIIKGPTRKCILTQKKDGTDFELITIENTYIQDTIIDSIDKLIEEREIANSIGGK